MLCKPSVLSGAAEMKTEDELDFLKDLRENSFSEGMVSEYTLSFVTSRVLKRNVLAAVEDQLISSRPRLGETKLS